jgi:hypothetical protein
MPYRSEKQRRWAHTPAGVRKLGKRTVEEFDRASRGVNVPETAPRERRVSNRRRRAR